MLLTSLTNMNDHIRSRLLLYLVSDVSYLVYMAVKESTAVMFNSSRNTATILYVNLYANLISWGFQVKAVDFPAMPVNKGGTWICILDFVCFFMYA